VDKTDGKKRQEEEMSQQGVDNWETNPRVVDSEREEGATAQ
jgi:hypothetical protein